MSRGLRDFQAAAIVGNLQQESGIRPQLEAMDTNGKPGRGIAMWQPPRWNQLVAFAGSRDPWALDTQLDFLWSELQSNPAYGLSQILSSTTLEAAVVAFQDNFEKCSDCRTPNRISYAQSALYACPGVVPPPTPASKTPGIATAAVGLFALVAAVGYTVYELVVSRRPDELEPFYRRDAYRPQPQPRRDEYQPRLYKP